MNWTVRGLNPGWWQYFSHTVLKISEKINFLTTPLESRISITDVFLYFHFNERNSIAEWYSEILKRLENILIGSAGSKDKRAHYNVALTLVVDVNNYSP